MNRIDNVIFDFGGVLVDLRPEVSLARFRELGVSDIDEMLNPYRQYGVFHDLEMGLVGREGFASLLNQHADTNLTDADIEEAILLFIGNVSRYKFDYIDTLRPGRKVYILSNTNPYIMSYAHSDRFLPGSGRVLSDYVDKVYASCKMLTMKPDREIYEKMIADSGMLPEHSLFIDDSMANLEAAQAVGLQTLHVTNGSDWRPLLDELLR